MLIFVPGFVFGLYPAFQVPFAFIILIFILNDFIKHRKQLNKQDYVIIGISLILILGMIAYFIKIAWKDINIMMNTIYPGKRFEYGGDYTLSDFIGYIANIFFPYNSRIYNLCEPSTYIYPFIALILGMISYFWKVKQEKIEENGLLMTLSILYLIYLIWIFVGFDKIFATISLLYFSPARRTQIVVGLLGTLLTIMILKNRSEKEYNKNLARAISFIVSVITVIIASKLIENSDYKNYFLSWELKIVKLMLFCMAYFFLTANKKIFCSIMCIIAVVAGITVNPIACGTKVLYETEIAKKIQEIVEKDKDALWAGNYNWHAQYVLANGANTLNGIHNYPNFEWLSVLDPSQEYMDVYNRYAHIAVILDDKTKFEILPNSYDSYQVHMTYKDLKSLEVKYYFTNKEFSDEIKEKYHMEYEYCNKEKKQYIYVIN